MNQGIIVYYSRTGTVRQLADALAEHLGWPVAEIADVKSRAGLSGDLRCVLDTLLHHPVQYRYSGPALDRYDHVIVLAPVWMGRLAAPMRSFLADNLTAMSHVAHVSAICVMAARGGYRAITEISRLTARTLASTLVVLQRDVLSGTVTANIDRFAQSLRLADLSAHPVQRPAWLSPNAT